MDAYYCKHCGSPNHLAFDCSQKHLTFVPPEQPKPPQAPEPAKAPPEPVFEVKPRWPGAPPICTATNFLAFKDSAEAAAFREANAPGCHVEKVWQCEHCNMTHFHAEPRAPAGTTSGTERSSKLPKGFVPFRRKMRESAFAHVQQQPALPASEANEVKANKTLASKPEKAHKKAERSGNELF